MNISKKSDFKSLLILLLLCSSMSISAQRVINLNSEDVGLNLRRTTAIPQEFLEEAKTARSFAINPALQSANHVSLGDTINLHLFENSIHTAVVRDVTTDVNGSFTLSLDLPNYMFAFGFITTNKEGKSLFSVSIPEHSQRFVSRSVADSQTNFLIELDGSAELPSDEKEIPAVILMSEEDYNQEADLRIQSNASNLPCTWNRDLAGTDPAIIDVLVVYTHAAAVWAQREGGITNTIAGAMDFTNRVVNNQRNGDQIRVVHSQQINHTELTHDMSADLRRLTYDWVDVHQLRKQHNADLVVLIGEYLPPSPGGIAWVLSDANEGRVHYGFSITRVQQASWTYTFIHEIGHNMGMRHHREDYAVTPNTLFPYAFGWHWMSGGTRFGSVMSTFPGQTRVSFFSNPNETYNGVATGANNANNAQVFRNTKHIVAFYSEKLHHLPDAPTNIVVSSPTDNGATFSWEAVPNATTYRIHTPNLETGSGSVGWTDPRNSRPLSSTARFQPCTTYEFWVSALNDCGDIASSSRFTFTTRCINTDPTVITSATVSNITHNSVILNSTVTPASGTPIQTQGFRYRKASATGWNTSTDGSLTGLTPNTQYRFHAFATTALGTFNGNVLSFTTSSPVPPTVVTQDAIVINCNSATLNKSVTAQTEAITSQGFEYKISGEESWSVSTNGELSGLTENALYVFRAFATTASGTVYGNELTFTPTATQTQTIDFPEFAQKTYGDADITLPQKTSAGLTINYKSSDEMVAVISENILTITGVGVAEITATQSGDCTYTAATEVTRTLMVGRAPTTDICQVLARQLHIFPNPAQNELFIQSELQINRVEIYSTTGALMIEENNFAEKISVSALPRGIYLLKVHTNKGVIVSKFIKE